MSVSSQLLTGFAIGTALAAVAAWLGWLLVLAHAWVVERWGRRLGAYLVLKGRDLRQKSIALSPDCQVVLPKGQALGYRNRERNQHRKGASNRANRSPEVAHSVVPFRRKG